MRRSGCPICGGGPREADGFNSQGERNDDHSVASSEKIYGVWRSLVARLSGGQEVVGSNPATPTKNCRRADDPYVPRNGRVRDSGRLGHRSSIEAVRWEEQAVHKNFRSVAERYTLGHEPETLLRALGASCWFNSNHSYQERQFSFFGVSLTAARKVLTDSKGKRRRTDGTRKSYQSHKL